MKHFKGTPTNLTVVVLYAPTLSDDPERTDLFQVQPQSAVNSVIQRDILVIAGDWNVRVGPANPSTRIQDPTSVIHLKPLRANPAISQFTLRVSGDPAATARGLYGVGVALSPRAERALLDWIPVNSPLSNRFCIGTEYCLSCDSSATVA